MVKDTNIRITITIPKHTHAKLSAFAWKANKSISRIITSMLTRKIEDFITYESFNEKALDEIIRIVKTPWLDDEED